MLSLSTSDRLLPVLIGVWVVFGLFASAFFFVSKNANLKRKAWPPFMIAGALVFLGFSWTMGFSARMFFFELPVVALITFLNVRAMRFCDACGKTNTTQNHFSPARFCSKCGASLER